MTAPPATLEAMPIQPVQRVRSPVNQGAQSATQTGAVLTRTVLAATEVKPSEEIQVAKCKASKAPESMPVPSSLRLSPANSDRARPRAKGSTAAAAIVMRHAAVTSGGDSHQRTRIEPVERESTPSQSTSIGLTRGGARSAVVGWSLMSGGHCHNHRAGDYQSAEMPYRGSIQRGSLVRAVSFSDLHCDISNLSNGSLWTAGR